jgi:hypothetical protein
VGYLERRPLVSRPGEVDLHRQALALPAAFLEGRDHLLELLGGLVDRDQAVRPLRHPARGLDADRRTDQGRRLRRPREQPRMVHAHQPVVADGLAGKQRADDVHALAQPLISLRLGGPALTRDVLVRGLAGAERHPQPPREHLAQRAGRLGDDRRVVALSGRVDHSERKRGRLHGRAEERPRESRVPLTLAPRREVVGRHGRLEADRLGMANGLQQLAGCDLLVRGVDPDARHVTEQVPARGAGANLRPPPPATGWAGG